MRRWGNGAPVPCQASRSLARDAFKAMPVKSDRNDARGIAQLMRLGWFRPVHCKSIGAQEIRAELTARKLVESKLRDTAKACAGFCAASGSRLARPRSEAFRVAFASW